MVSGKKTISKVATQLQAQRQPRQILRTIVLPNEQINTLQVEIEKLRLLNEEQRALYEQEILALKEDRRAREEEMRIKYVDRNIICQTNYHSGGEVGRAAEASS